MPVDVKLPSWMSKGTQRRVRQLVDRGFAFNFGDTPEKAQVVFGETERVRYGRFDRICIVREEGRASYAWRLQSEAPMRVSSLQAQASYDDVLDAVLKWPVLVATP